MKEIFIVCMSVIFLCHAPVYSEIDEALLKDLPFIDGREEDSMYYAAPYLPDAPVILEAGTCGAEDTCRFKELWKDSVIYGFEPVPYLYKNTMKNVKNLKNVTVYPCALSNQVGTATFYVAHRNMGCSSLLPDNFGSVIWPFDSDPTDKIFPDNHYLDEAIEVPTTTVNLWGKENNISHIDYMWLDTEGAELMILSAATDFLPNVRVITIEVNFQEFRLGMTQFQDLYQFLSDQGFTLKYLHAIPKWQGIAMFVNNKILEEELNFNNRYLIPEPKNSW